MPLEVMVLSEVVKRLIVISRVGRLTYFADFARTTASRLNEVATPSQHIAGPVEPGPEAKKLAIRSALSCPTQTKYHQMREFVRMPGMN